MPDIHIPVEEPSESELEDMTYLMLEYIMPNTPVTEEEKEAFDKAIRYQIAHEKTILEQSDFSDLPDGVSSFNIGTFSMAFKDGYEHDNRLTRGSICPYAYSVLLRAGLLYRGVIGRRCGCLS